MSFNHQLNLVEECLKIIFSVRLVLYKYTVYNIKSCTYNGVKPRLQ